MLSHPLTESLSKLRFPESCSGQQVNLYFDFRLLNSYPSASPAAKLIAPNHWLMEAAPLIVSDEPTLATITKRHWWQRIFHR